MEKGVQRSEFYEWSWPEYNTYMLYLTEAHAEDDGVVYLDDDEGLDAMFESLKYETHKAQNAK